MRRARRGLTATRTATALTALMALMAGSLLAPATVAAAGCAFPHYLVLPDGMNPTAHLDLLTSLGAVLAADESLPGPGTPAPTPCGSWRCHDAPSSPAPLSPVAAPNADFWLLAAEEFSTRSGARADRLAHESAALRPIRVPTSVFHPPR